MQISVANDVLRDGIPNGWEIIDKAGNNRLGVSPNANALKLQVDKHFPVIAHRVEAFIDKVYLEFHLAISEAFISVNEDATYHVVLLIDQEDCHTPELLAAKIRAEELLKAAEDISARCTFTVAK